MLIPAALWPALFHASTGGTWPSMSAEEALVFIKQAAAENLLPLLLSDDSVPGALHNARKPYAALLRVQMQRTQILIRTLRRVAEILEGEEFILLKGSDYAFRLYTEPHLRPMGDIDLLVPASRMASIRERFLAAGMQQHFPSGHGSRLRTYHEMSFTLDGVLIEPHQAFIHTTRHRIDYEAIWSRRVAFAPAGVAAFRLDDSDALLYQTLRMALDHFNEPLIHSLDLYLLLHQFNGDFEEMAHRARDYRIERAFFAALRQITRCFPDVAERVDPLLTTVLTPRVRRHIEQRVLPHDILYRRIPRRVELWRKFNLMDGYRERGAFLIQSAYASIAGLLAPRAHAETRGVTQR